LISNETTKILLIKGDASKDKSQKAVPSEYLMEG
jgi:hypothetical protein